MPDKPFAVGDEVTEVYDGGEWKRRDGDQFHRANIFHWAEIRHTTEGDSRTIRRHVMTRAIRNFSSWKTLSDSDLETVYAIVTKKPEVTDGRP